MISKRKSLYTFIIVCALGIVSVCYSEISSNKVTVKQVREETQDFLQTLSAYTIDQKNEAIEKIEAALDNLDGRIDALETRIDENWDEMNRVAREKTRAKLKILRKQRIEVAERYGSLKNSTSGAWEELKAGFSDAYKVLNNAWEKSEKEFTSQ